MALHITELDLESLPAFALNQSQAQPHKQRHLVGFLVCLLVAYKINNDKRPQNDHSYHQSKG
jgi:hypothetical protein